MRAVRNGKLTKKALAEAVASVECSCMANSFGDETLNGYRATAEMAAVDWLNERKLGDDGKAAQIVAAVLGQAGIS